MDKNQIVPLVMAVIVVLIFVGISTYESKQIKELQTQCMISCTYNLIKEMFKNDTDINIALIKQIYEKCENNCSITILWKK